MRLLFLVPSAMHKTTAGSRIRYDRLGAISDYLNITVQSMDEVTSADLESCDVCVFSKTYSVEAVAIAHKLRRSGKLVGIDLFDDYFSQGSDSRLTRFRIWLRRFSGV